MNTVKSVILLLLVSLCICCAKETTTGYALTIIPKPQSLEIGTGSFTISSETTFSVPSGFEIASSFLKQYLEKGAGIGISKISEKEADIVFKRDTTLVNEGYTLTISEENITITSKDADGAFYAVQTMRQLLPPTLERLNSFANPAVNIPCVTITDAPKFEYRGMHLDVSRHFFPKEFIKEYISHLAMLKMNRFHWHLTDDQGWRIEIKQYPELTTHAAYRDETLIGHYNETPQQFDGKRYGGFYTQEEVKEIIAFAAQHNISIIPEIEMPGHAQAAISAYPELGCASSGAAIPVATKWGVFENVYCPNEKTFVFLKNTLTEVMDLFPGEYIHIGGDEAPKTKWKTCSHCQQLIKTHDLKDEHGLQSYFIKEIEAFVNSKGKKIIGWDEILEGGLAPNATVMSWRGTEGAITAAKEGHDVILTPTSHAYFDYYQDDHPDEPLAIGGFLPLKKVFGFNPIPPQLEGKQKDKVLGAQGNIWTEYIKTEEQVEYMAFPRILAMAQVVWSGPAENLEKEYPVFLQNVESFTERLDVLGVNYANHLYDLEGLVVKKDESVFFELKTPTSGKEIKYSVNASGELTYDKPLKISEDTEIIAQVYKNSEKVGRSFNETIRYHKGVPGSISLNVDPHSAYSAGGEGALINGVSGSDTRYGDKEWLGFWGDDLEVTITFPEPIEFSKLSTRFYNAKGQWIYAPKNVVAFLYLENGDKVASSIRLDNENSNTLVTAEIDHTKRPFSDVKSIVITVPSYGVIPEGMQGAGNKAWTFIDEIIIE